MCILWERISREPLVFEGKQKEVIAFINKKTAEWSNKCDCRKNLKVKCTQEAFGFTDMITLGKEYEVGDTSTDTGEYWLEDDNGEYNPFPQELFKEIKHI